MKKIYINILLTAIAVLTILGCCYYIYNGKKAKSDGTVTIELISLENEVIKTKNIDYVEGDTLKGLIEENFENVYFEGTMLMNIEDYQTPSDWSTFISVYVDGEMSMVGINEITLVDEMVVSLIITEFIYEY